MDERFALNECLYRGLHPMWIEDDNTVSSAAFKDSGGVSVDRDGGRCQQECVDRLLEAIPQLAGVCKLSVGDVEACDAITVYRPLSDNEYHSEIHDFVGQVQIKSKSKAKKLSSKSRIVFKKKMGLTLFDFEARKQFVPK